MERFLVVQGAPKPVQTPKKPWPDLLREAVRGPED
ncbi:hypothetical protein MUK42_15761 [Musa troglodytarum]|uniref:Uncharacterized protein n=1 Tax=Musa troglodytarum TaxID=320322 RepID=A0A9E7HVU4_9LILI|nr:hypothetical protein MUK42_15761 [Musa troglodytarum]